MKQIFKYILIGLSLLAVPKVAGAQAVHHEGGVATTKTVSALDEYGNYTIKLETWAEGETAVVETATPVNVVLVLDVSGSMAWPKGDYSQSTKTSYSYNDIVKGEVEYFRRYNPQSDYIEKIYGEEVVVGGQTRYYLYISPDDGTGNNQGTYLQSNGATTTGRSNAAYATSPTATIVTPSGSEGYGWGATQRTDLFYQGKSRIVALQEAVCAFIDKIEENDLKDKQGEPRAERLHNKIAIVKFAGQTHVNSYNNNETIVTLQNTENNVASMKKAVNALMPKGATQTASGMELANAELANADDDASKVVVLFTDGDPTDERNSAIGEAYTSKHTYDAIVYTVGVFTSSPGTTTPTYRYLNYISSNYPDAQRMNSAGTQESTDYYKDASGNVDLTAIFVSISEGIGGAETTVAASTQIRDVVSSSFTIPQGFDASQVVIYSVRAKKQATLAWDPNTRQDYTPAADQTDAVSAVIDEQDGHKRLVVTGFDFSKADTPTGSNSGNGNWVGERYTQADGRFIAGAKLVIEFKIKEVAGATGGAGTNTNTSDSGVWVKKEDGTYDNINHYVIPHTTLPVNIVIKKNGLRSGESATFEVEKCRPKNWDENKTLEQNIAAMEYNEIGKPEPSGNWSNFSKVILTNKGADKAEVTKTLVALDPYWIYRVNEDKWSWAYTLSGNTGAEGSIPNTSTVEVNPFSFTNTEKEGVVKHAEAVTINHFGYTIKTGDFAGQQEEHYKSSKVEKL